MNEEKAVSPFRESLWDLCSELAAYADSEPAPESEALLAEWIGDMAQRTTAVAKKVDRWVQFLHVMSANVDAVKQQAAYYKQRAGILEAGMERVEALAVRIVDQFASDPPLDRKGKPKHAKRLEGIAGYIGVTHNPDSVDDAINMAELPREFMNATLKLTGEEFGALFSIINSTGTRPALADRLLACVTFTPNKEALGRALAEMVTCPTCEGRAFADTPAPDGTVECETCGFTGKVPRTVPGARLKAGGMRLLLPRMPKGKEVAK